MPSLKERAFDAAVEINSVFADLKDYSEYASVLEEIIKKLFHIDWLCMASFSKDSDSYTILTNPHLPFDWREKYGEVYHLDKIRKDTLNLNVGCTYIYDRERCKDEGQHYVCELAKKYTDTSHYFTIHTGKTDTLDSALGLYRSDKNLKFTAEERTIIECLSPVLVSTTSMLNLYRTFDFQRVVIDELRKEHNEMSILFSCDLDIIDLPKKAERFLQAHFLLEKNRPIPRLISDWIQSTIAPQGKVVPNSGPWLMEIQLSSMELYCKAYTAYTELGKPVLLLKLIPHGGATDFSILRARGLTKREIETLSYLPLGYSNAQIAIAMNIKEVTVRKHLKNCSEKLCTQGRTELLYQALTLKELLSHIR